ncbi:hypothetical protein LCGC14_2003130 [marine sediment metagenome]|uniref:Uncharacterized protein n=1 Tax=marine sediment metagenome TaxID=412755 RepID=A0A0F9FQC2_9ZZZZ
MLRSDNILQIENDRLKESDMILSALEAAGVDNWDGYDIAIGIMIVLHTSMLSCIAILVTQIWWRQER